MTPSEYYYASCDLLLQTYESLPGGFLSYEQLNEALRQAPVPDKEEVYSFLMEEGMLQEVEGGFKITRRGRIFINEGGFNGRLRRERISRILMWVGTASSIVAAIAALLALLF